MGDTVSDLQATQFTFKNMAADHHRYCVPEYQRGYAWKLKNVKEFLEDLLECRNTKSDHFFGTFFVTGKNPLYILDGQQRITTAFLFIHLLNKSNTEKETTQSDEYRNLLTVNGKSRLKLGSINQKLFEALLNNAEVSDKMKCNSDSNKNLYAAYEEIEKFIQKHKTNIPKLGYYFLKHFVMIKMSGSIKDSHRRFSLINNRGLPLMQSDLVKSHLMGKLATEHTDSEKYEETWTEIDKLVTGTGKYDMDGFVQYVATLELDHDIRKNDSYRPIQKSTIPPKNWIVKFKHWAEIFATLRDPKNRTAYIDKRRRCIPYLEHIKSIKAEAVYYVLLAAFDVDKSPGKFDTLAAICLKYHLRTKTIGSAKANKVSAPLKDVAKTIYKNRKINIPDIIKILKKDSNTYIDNSSLEDRIRTGKRSFDKESSKTILLLLDDRLGTVATLEHIMPESLTPNDFRPYIPDSSDDIKYDYGIHVNLLGNLTLMTQEENSRAGDKPFLEKQEIYKKSSFKMTRDIGNTNDYSTWNIKKIKERQRSLSGEIADILEIDD